MIPVLTSLLKKIDGAPNQANCFSKLKSWYWSAIFTNAYSQAADSQMTTDYKELIKWFEDDDKTPKVIKDIERGIQILDFRGIQSKSNARYRGLMSMYALEGAKDFDSEQTLENARQNDKDHIFPKSFRFGFGSNQHINSILNMTWMSDNTNRKIKGFKKPSVYVPEFIKEKYSGDENRFRQLLETHFINQRAYDFLIIDDYESFLTEREKVILGRIAQNIGITIDDTPRTIITDSTPFSNRLAFQSTIASCSDMIYWLDKYFTTKGMEVLYGAKNDIKDIKIIMAIEKVSKEFRRVFKDFKREMELKGITVVLKVMVDPKVKRSVHDRFIISKYDAFNIPSPDTIARGQLSEISKARIEKNC